MTQGTTSPNPRTTAKHLLLLTMVACLINVPFFSSRMIFVHDTLDSFIFFHYTYSEFYWQGELPRWVPTLGFGMPYDFHIFGTLQPTHYVAMAFGWLCGIKDALLLFKLSLLLSQVLFVLGLYALARRLFSFMLPVWAVCLGALLTNSWMHNCLLNFTIFYLLPLVFYLILAYCETAKPGYLWAAGIVESLSLIGTLTYVAPLHLLILFTFVLTYCCREPGRALLLVRWRALVHPLFFVFAGFLVLLALLVLGVETDFVAPGRDPLTGNVNIEEFLNFYRQPLAGMAVAMTLGQLTNGDMTNYVGFLPLVMLGYGLMRRRDTPFLALLAVAFVLLWFSLGGYFSVACHDYFPLMKKFRQISYAFNLLKVFVLLLGGLGFDQWLRDVRGSSSCDKNRLGRWGRTSVAVLLLAFAADFVYSIRASDLTDCWLNYCDRSFAQGPWTRYCLMGRYLGYASVLGGVLLALRAGINRKLLGLTGTALFAVYVADVGMYYLAMVKYAHFGSGAVAVAHVFDACPLIYGEQRIRFDAKAPPPGRARDIINILRDVDGAFPPPNSTLYASLYLLFRIDPIEPIYRIDLVIPGIKHMVEAAGGSLPASHGQPGIYLPDSDRFKQSLGFGKPKIRIVRAATFVENEREACAKLKLEENPQAGLIIVDERRAGIREDKSDRPMDDSIHVTKFTANRMEIDVVAGAPGWLFDADAFDRGWKATVDGRPADVFRANVGCKAVYVQEGRQHVVFDFDRGLRDWVCRGVMYITAFFGFVLIGGAIILGLTEPGRRAGEGTQNSPDEGPCASARLTLMIWSTCALLGSLGCAFLLVPAMID